MVGADADLDDEVLLEVLNSTPVVDGAVRDAWHVDDGLRTWARNRGGTGTVAEAERLRAVRDALQGVVAGAEPVSSLQAFLRGVSASPRLGDEGVAWILDVVEGDDLLAARLVLRWAQVQERLPGRLRACANDECRLFLLDRSRAGTARWCSMKTCGNRLKARRHHERTRAQSPPTMSP